MQKYEKNDFCGLVKTDSFVKPNFLKI